MSLSSSFSAPCTNVTGGLSEIFLVDKADIDTVSVTSNEITAITMQATKVFYSFDFEQDTAAMRNNASRENYSTVVSHELEFYLNKMTTAQRDALQDIIDSSTCGMVALVKDANSQYWCLGWSQSQELARPLKVQSIESTTGAAFTDGNGSTVILSSSDTEMPLVFTGTVPV